MRTVRESDSVGRLGGDEFAALLLQANETAVEAFLARLRERLPPGLQFSAGTAYVSDGLADSEALFDLADKRLYEEKNGSRSLTHQWRRTTSAPPAKPPAPSAATTAKGHQALPDSGSGPSATTCGFSRQAAKLLR